MGPVGFKVIAEGANDMDGAEVVGTGESKKSYGIRHRQHQWRQYCYIKMNIMVKLQKMITQARQEITD